MSISVNVKALLALSGKKQSDLAELLSMSSRQSLSNKFTNERWSADDLVDVAEFCGCKLAFIMPSGQQLVFEKEKGAEE